MRLGDYQWLNALWLIPALVVLMSIGARSARRGFDRFIDGDVLRQRMSPDASATRRWTKNAVILIALACLSIGLARPQWNAQVREMVREGRDVVFVIDVSRSMLAEDLAPNRLERSKIWVRDVIDTLNGDRVALVAFAGSAVVKCPLTHDYGFFQFALEDLSPGSVSRGGTLIGDAIRLTLEEVFDTEEAKYRDIILITDGEDHDSFPVEAAKAAGEHGIRIIALGIGDENEGRRIPITDEDGRLTYVQYDGKDVFTRLDGETLRGMALASHHGRYLNVSTGNIELDSVYEDLVKQAEQYEMKASTIMQYDEKFQIFLGLALILLVTEECISARRRVATN